MTNESGPAECPPHHWEITLVRLAAVCTTATAAVAAGPRRTSRAIRARAWSRRPGRPGTRGGSSPC